MPITNSHFIGMLLGTFASIVNISEYFANILLKESNLSYYFRVLLKWGNIFNMYFNFIFVTNRGRVL